MTSQPVFPARAPAPADPSARTRDGERDNALRTPAVNTNFLLEMVVCEAHWCAMQVATLANMSSACSRPDAKCNLQACRHLLHDDNKVMLLALRYAGEIGLSADDAAKLSALYRGIGDAQKDLSRFAEAAVLSQSQRNLLRSHSAIWRRLAAEAAVAIGQIEASTRARVNRCYSEDAEILRKYLRRAADGETRDVDSFGVVHPPELKQRRRSPRIAIQRECTLILPTGSCRAKLEDVSREGMSFVCPQPLVTGQKLAIALDDGRKLDAVVVRRQGAIVGVSLSRPLSAMDPLFKTAPDRPRPAIE